MYQMVAGVGEGGGGCLSEGFGVVKIRICSKILY